MGDKGHEYSRSKIGRIVNLLIRNRIIQKEKEKIGSDREIKVQTE